MEHNEKPAASFVGYEYKKVLVNEAQASMYRDCYRSFGWIADENTPVISRISQVTMQLKRDRKLVNRTELTRLQQHFEACANEIETLEKTKHSIPTMWAIIVGILGTAFMAGSTFAAVATPPIIWLCVVLAVPGFIGWGLPYFIYKKIQQERAVKVTPLIEKKYDEIYEICQKGAALL